MSSRPASPVELAARWREEAGVLRRRGVEGRAELLEQMADEAEAAFEAWREAELSVGEAADWSGYSRERLRELTRAGLIPDRRPPGSRQGVEYRLRRSDLPRKPLGKRDPDAMPQPGARESGEGESPAERAARRAFGSD